MDRIKTIATVTIALALVGILVMFVRLHLKADAMMYKIERIEGLMPVRSLEEALAWIDS